MGFLKFLKREKKKDEFEELDLPPAPPPLEGDQTGYGYGFDENLPELPDFPEFEEEKISAPEEEFKFDMSEEKNLDVGEEELPEFPIMPEVEEEAPPQAITPTQPISTSPTTPEPAPLPQPAIPEQPSQEEAKLPEYPKIERRLFVHERRSLRERTTAKTIYVRVDKFKATLGSISMVRSDLRKSEEALMKLENIKNAKDRSFDRIKVSLDDLQRKLIFVDKTLFKGD